MCRFNLIGFINDLDRDSGLFKKSAKDKAETLLNKLADETGGKAFLPQGSFPRSTQSRQQIFYRPSYAIFNQLLSKQFQKGRFVFAAVKVQVNGGSRRLVRTQLANGYTAPREGENPQQ